MQQPLKHKPMGYCDPNTVKPDDIVLHRALNTPYGGVAPRLKYNSEHVWYCEQKPAPATRTQRHPHHPRAARERGRVPLTRARVLQISRT